VAAGTPTSPAAATGSSSTTLCVVASEPPTVGHVEVGQKLLHLDRDLTQERLALSIEVSGGLVQTVRR